MAANSMDYQINDIMIPVINYWSDPPVPYAIPDGFRIVDDRELFVEGWIEGIDRLAYVKELRELGVPEQEIADLIFRKETCALYKIWKATGGIIVEDLKSDNVLYNAFRNAIFFDFDITTLNSTFGELFDLHVSLLGYEIAWILTTPPLPVPDAAYSIAGYYDAMMEEVAAGKMTVEQVWSEISKLAAIDMEAYNEAVEIILPGRRLGGTLFPIISPTG